MPAGTRPQIGNVIFDMVLYLPSVTYPTLAANASGVNTVAIPGALPGDLLSWNLQAPPAHLVLDNLYVSAPGVVTILWSSDATGISTGAVAILLEAMRPENESMGLSALPTNML